MTLGTIPSAYRYDLNGNLIQENTERHFEWDHGDRMRVYRTQPDNAEPSVHAHYLYDASGQRVKKLVRKQGGQVEAAVYINSIFEHHALTQGGVTNQNNTLHVMDNQSRIALVRMGEAFPGDGAADKPVKYHLSDHLGSSNVVIDDSGNLINREEYTPYGESSFGSFARKRYRFTGKERDEESGLYYHGARYYAPWLERWMSCDPMWFSGDTAINTNNIRRRRGAEVTVIVFDAGSNRSKESPSAALYVFSLNNPVRYQDPDGRFPKEIPNANPIPILMATHRGITTRALLGKAGPERLEQIIQGNLAVDYDQNTSPFSTAKHAMRSVWNSAEDAKMLREAIVDDLMSRAAESILKGKVKEAAKLFGAATHTIQDRFAKAHSDPGGNPAIWRIRDTIQHVRIDKSERLYTENANKAVEATQSLFDRLYNLVQEKAKQYVVTGSENKSGLTREEIEKRWHRFTDE